MATVGSVIASNRDTFSALVFFSIMLFVMSLGSFFVISATAVGGE